MRLSSILFFYLFTKCNIATKYLEKRNETKIHFPKRGNINSVQFHQSFYDSIQFLINQQQCLSIKK